MSVVAFVRRMLWWFRPYPWRSAAIFAGLLVEMAWTATVPKGLQHLIDYAITPHDYGVLVRLLVFLGVGAVVVSAVGLYRDFVYARLSNAITNDLRLRLFDHLQLLSLSFHSRQSAGDIASRFSTDIESVKQALQSCIAWGMLPTLDVIVANVLLFSIEWRLALIAQLIWPLALAGPRVIAPRATSASFRYKQEEGQALANVHESVVGRPVIKAFGLEPTVRERFVERLGTLGRIGMHTAFLGSLLERSSGIGIMLLQVAVLGVGGTLAYHGSLTVGGLVAFQSLFISMSYALFYLAQYVPTLSSSAASLQRLDEIFDQDSTLPDPPSPKPLPPLNHEIAVDDVVFSHVRGVPNLNGVSAQHPPGRIRWRSSSVPQARGRARCWSLLLRFYDPDSGAVRYDGVDLRDVARADLVRQSGVVFQDSFLFNLTLRENIRLGRLDATDAEVETAARDAEIHDFIMTLPRGYDTPAGEGGAGMSGGQRQRIAIARALVRNPRVLFLDEATSALDPGAEASINETIARVSRGRTVVSVTHRLSSVTNLDRVFVLDRGRLAGAGTHTELLAQGGVYAALWRKQSGLRLSTDGSQAVITPDRLRAIPLLSSLDNDTLATLAGSRFVSELLPAGRTVVVEGDPGDKFFILVRGSVAVTRRAEDGTERRLAVLQDGDHFGEISLIRNVPRTATVKSLTSIALLSLHRGQFDSLLEQAPGLREQIRQRLAQRERELADRGHV